MTREEWGWLIWGLWFLLFVALELPAAFGKTPWSTLSTTTMTLQVRWGFVTPVILGGLSVLLGHIVRWRNIQAGQLYEERKAELHYTAAVKHFKKGKQAERKTIEAEN